MKIIGLFVSITQAAVDRKVFFNSLEQDSKRHLRRVRTPSLSSPEAVGKLRAAKR